MPFVHTNPKRKRGLAFSRVCPSLALGLVSQSLWNVPQKRWMEAESVLPDLGRGGDVTDEAYKRSEQKKTPRLTAPSAVTVPPKETAQPSTSRSAAHAAQALHAT